VGLCLKFNEQLNYLAFAQQGINGAAEALVALTSALTLGSTIFSVQQAFSHPLAHAFFSELSALAQHAFSQPFAQAFFSACAASVPHAPQ